MPDFDKRDPFFVSGYKHGTINEALMDAMTLGEIIARPVTAVFDDAENIALPTRIALFNKKRMNERNADMDSPDTGFLEIVGSNYPLIQPRLSFSRILEAFKKYGMETLYWKFEENAKGNLAYMDILFDRKEQMLRDPTSSQIWPGVTMKVQSDGTAAVLIDYYWWRQVCSNGAKAKTLCETTRIEHKGDQDVTDEAVHEFLARSAAADIKLMALINEAYGDEIDDEQAWRLLGNMPVKLQKKANDIWIYEHRMNQNRYELFNIVTNLISNITDETKETLHKYLDAAENILLGHAKNKRDKDG